MSGPIVVALQHARAFRIVGEVIGSLRNRLLGGTHVVRAQIHGSQCNTGLQLLRIGCNGCLQLRLSAWQVILCAQQSREQHVRLHVLVVESDGLFELLTRLGQVFSTCALQQTERGVEVRPVRADGERLVDGLDRFVAVAAHGIDVCLQGDAVDVVRLLLQNEIGLLGGPVGKARLQQQVAERDVRIQVVWTLRDSHLQLGKGLRRHAHLQECLAQLIVRRAEIFIGFERVKKLQAGFAVLAFLGVALTTLKVFLLADVWVAIAS